MIIVGHRGGSDCGDIDDGVKKENVLFFSLTIGVPKMFLQNSTSYNMASAPMDEGVISALLWCSLCSGVPLRCEVAYLVSSFSTEVNDLP